MNDHLVITLSRTYGSGGRELAGILGKRLGLNFYGSELAGIAAERSGIRKEYFDRVDEQPTDSFLYTLATNAMSFGGSVSPYDHTLSSEKLFNKTADIIREIADREDCIIIGRCGGYILREMPRCVKIFLHAPMDFRIERVMTYENCDRHQAERSIKTTDKRRENYFGYYTGRDWGASNVYDLTLDTSLLGLEGAATMIEEYLKLRFGDNK